MHTNTTTTSGIIIAATGHSGRRRSCSMQSMTTKARGIVSVQSSNTPMSIVSMTTSLESAMVTGRYHKCPKAKTAKNAAVQRRSLRGVVTSAAKALPRRNSR